MDDTKYKIFLIEDNELDQAAFKRFVEQSSLPYDCRIAASVAEARIVLAEERFDVIVADYLLGDGTAFDILDSVKDTPTIFVTGAGDQDVAVKAWKAGAYDYLIKDSESNYLKAVPITIENAIRHRKTEELVRHSYDVQAVFNELLGLSLEDLTLEEMMARAIEHITSISWLALESKGAIFLIEEDPEMLVMKAAKGISEQVQAMCNRVAFGECVCGRAAASKEIIFSDKLDERHDYRCEGICEHGHYCVPMLTGGEVIGVIDTYVKEGHERRIREEDFLRAASMVVAGIVERKRAEESLKKVNEELESAVRILSGVTDVLIPRGSVFKRHKAR